MNCSYCTKTINGNAVVDGNYLLHPECVAPCNAKFDGRTYECPVCTTKGKIEDKSRPIRKLVKEANPPCAYDGCWGCRRCMEGILTTIGYHETACSLCEGWGWTKTPAKPITKIVGYEL